MWSHSNRGKAGQTGQVGVLAFDLEQVAQARWLIVASDFDGTLATLVHDPSEVSLGARNEEVFRKLVATPATTTAVVSGRSFADLHRKVGHIGGLRVVGAHGREIDATTELSPDQLQLLVDVESEIRSMSQPVAGVIVEPKNAGVAIHTQRAEPDVVNRLTEEITALLVEPNGLHVQTGKHLFEIAIHAPDKGLAVHAFRQEATALGVPAAQIRTVFIGDDLTDEKGFAALDQDDIGVKVGPGKTLASHRVAGLAEVTDLLEVLALNRGQLTD